MKEKRPLQSVDKRKIGYGNATTIICGLMPFEMLGDTL